MMWIIFKYVITAAVVVAASEAAKKSDLWGALIVSLPMVSLLTLIWLYVENQPTEKLGNRAVYTFWYVLPTLPMF
jgi:F0F1-type ATP synthase assembly protein I